MKNFIFAIALVLGLTANAFAASNGLPQPSAVRDLGNYPSISSLRTMQLGTQLVDKKTQVMKATYKVSVQGGTVGTVNLKDVDGKDAVLPNKAIIKQVIFDVKTACTTAASGTLAFTANSAGDLKAALAAASWTGLVAGIPVGTAATSIKLTAQRTLTATIATGTIAACDINAFIEYYISD
jgi:hypothetical protein